MLKPVCAWSKALIEEDEAMKSEQTNHAKAANSRGGVLVLVSLLLVVFIGFAAMAIDIGYLTTTKNELQNVADAAALAATGELGQIYMALGGSTMGPGVIGVTEQGTIEGIATSAALDNKAGGLNISVAGNVQIGIWDTVAHTFSPLDLTTPGWPNAVRVIAQRVAGSNGQITTFFAGIFGIDSMNVSADAVAALTGQPAIDPGETELPIGISHKQFVNNRCKDPLELHDTNNSCAGWHFFDGDLDSDGTPDNHPSGNSMGDLLLGMILAYGPEGEAYINSNFTFQGNPDPSSPGYQGPVSYTSPGIDETTTDFIFSGGTIASLFTSDGSGQAPMNALFDFFRTHDGDGNDAIWTTTVPVYFDQSSGDSCENPSGPRTIVGASDIVVTAVHGPPDNYLNIEPSCNIAPVRGGGGLGGTMGNIPNLVE
jgi:hypothetical protein